MITSVAQPTVVQAAQVAPPTPTVTTASVAAFQQLLASTSRTATAGSGQTSRTAAGTSAIVGSNPPAALRTVEVQNSAELTRALEMATAGTHIVLRDGTYRLPNRFDLRNNGTAEAPIVVRSANLHGATIDAPVSLAGDHTWLWGVRLTGTVTMAADYTRVGRSQVMVASGTDGIVIGTRESGVKGPVVEYNDIYVQGPGTGHSRGVFVNVRKWHVGEKAHEGAIVRGNLFQSDKMINNEDVRAIYVGTHRTDVPPISMLIEGNYLDRFDGQRGLYTKTQGTTFLNNTIIGGQGGIHVRTGGRAVIEGNWIEGTSTGIIVGGDATRIIGNYLEGQGTAIRLKGGSADGKHEPATNTVLIGNKGPVELGWGRFTGSVKVHRTTDTRIEAHDGPIRSNFAANTDIVDSTREIVTAARRLALSEVGSVSRLVTTTTGSIGTGGTNQPGDRVLDAMERQREDAMLDPATLQRWIVLTPLPEPIAKD